jgi:hypothetical protein
MRHIRIALFAAAVGGLFLMPAVADAQGRGRAVPRGSVRASRPPVAAVGPRYRPYYYRPYRPGVSFGFYYGYPWGFGPYAYGYGYPYYYGYRYGYGYPAYGYPGWAVRNYGGVRIDVPQRDAEVWVDGYFSGVVDEFDGVMQQVNLDPGPHHIEIRGDGYEPVAFDVNVEPGRTITYRTTLRQARP